MRVHLTDLAVRSLQHNGRNLIYWDDATPGFGIYVGRKWKTWTVMRGVTRERLTIGRYGNGGLSLAEARAEAKRLLSMIPEAKPFIVHFEKAKTEFLASNYKDASPRTAFEAARLLGKHFQAIHAKPVSDVTDTDIKEHLDKITAPSEQLHAYRVARCFLKWCTRPPRKYLTHSPMEGYGPLPLPRSGPCKSRDRRGRPRARGAFRLEPTRRHRLWRVARMALRTERFGDCRASVANFDIEKCIDGGSASLFLITCCAAITGIDL